jgi:hypothetical protein
MISVPAAGLSHMSFQSYLDNIQAKTGVSPDEFARLARERGLLEPGVKASAIVAWLKEDFGLGHGHAMAIVAYLKDRPSAPDRLEAHFRGAKAQWRAPFDALVQRLGGSVQVDPVDSYISLLEGGRKFAVVACTSARMDVGIKLDDAPATGRLEASGGWNQMVTHRVRVGDPQEIDEELIGWLEQAQRLTKPISG